MPKKTSSLPKKTSSLPMFPRFCEMCYKLETFSNVDSFPITPPNLDFEFYNIDPSQMNEEETLDPEKVLGIPKERVCIVKRNKKVINDHAGDTFHEFEVIPLTSRRRRQRESERDYSIISRFNRLSVKKQQQTVPISKIDFAIREGKTVPMDKLTDNDNDKETEILNTIIKFTSNQSKSDVKQDMKD